MEYNDMPEAVTALLMSFPGSFINDRNEFIADKRSNQYFILWDCRQPKDIDCKILEWLSRSASKGSPYMQEWRNQKYRNHMLDGINAYMSTGFSRDEMLEIYTYLGNACDHEKTIRFIQNNYNFSVLTTKQEKE